MKSKISSVVFYVYWLICVSVSIIIDFKIPFMGRYSSAAVCGIQYPVGVI